MERVTALPRRERDMHFIFTLNMNPGSIEATFAIQLSTI